MKKFLSLVLVLLVLLGLTGCDRTDYKKALELYEAGNYSEAMEIFAELGDYKDSAERAVDCKNALDYENAAAACANGDHATAISLYEGLGDYRDSAEKKAECEKALNHENAMAAYANGDYMTAIALFKKLGDYRDSAEKLIECYIAVHGEEMYRLISSLEVGDTVEFGTFEQDNDENTTGEKILWHVIDKDGGALLLLSDQILWYSYFSDEYVFSKSFSYTDSLFYGWLNNDFYASAFADEERCLILTNNPSRSGKVFLLSKEEAEGVPRSVLECTHTRYAWTEAKKSGGTCYNNIWALRSLITNYNGWDQGIVSYLVTSKSGRIFDGDGKDFRAGESGFPCGNSTCFTGIRPAIWISLDAQG